MDYKLIETFLCVYEECNVTRAAARLNIVQPAVSNQIKRLEAELQVELFERSRKGLSPTASGRSLYKLFAPVMENFRQAERRAYALGGAGSAELSIGLNPYVSDAIMSAALQAFRIRSPDTQLRIEEEFSPILIDRVANGALDLAVVHFGVKSDAIPPTLVAVPLMDEPLAFVERSPDSQGEVGAPMSLSSLSTLPLVLPRSRHGFRCDLEHAAARATVFINVELEINAPGPLLDLVAHSTMASVVPEITARRAMLHLPLRIRRLVDPPVSRTILYVHRRDRPLSSVLAQFVQVVSELLSNFLSSNPPHADNAATPVGRSASPRRMAIRA